MSSFGVMSFEFQLTKTNKLMTLSPVFPCVLGFVDVTLSSKE